MVVDPLLGRAPVLGTSLKNLSGFLQVYRTLGCRPGGGPRKERAGGPPGCRPGKSGPLSNDLGDVGGWQACRACGEVTRELVDGIPWFPMVSDPSGAWTVFFLTCRTSLDGQDPGVPWLQWELTSKGPPGECAN